MVGFFKMWSISGLTTDGAKLTEPLNKLGYCISNPSEFHQMNATEKTDMIALAKQFLLMKQTLDQYIETKSKTYHDDAVKFLVMLAATHQGCDGLDWNWQSVRHFSQGLYGSMADELGAFRVMNYPIINNLCDKITKLIESGVK